MEIECEKHHTGLMVSDVAAAVEYYAQKLGFAVDFTSGEPPAMAGVSLGKVQIFLDRGTPEPKGCYIYFVVEDVDALYELHRAAGVEIVRPPQDQEYDLRDYVVRDLHGYSLTFGQYIYTSGPPIRIERADVPVRLEKRLAALLRDLAEHKRMSLNSCLEEILLHTCEPLGDGVASPHTKSQLRYIQQLKEKHEIDYDSHASYRFVEEDR